MFKLETDDEAKLNIYRRYLKKKVLKERPVDPMSLLNEE